MLTRCYGTVCTRDLDTGDPIFYPEAGTKDAEHNFQALPVGSCAASGGLPTAQACFDAVAYLSFPANQIANKTAADATQPAGCSFSHAMDGSGTATFNRLVHRPVLN
jgi:hypothetical protein